MGFRCLMVLRDEGDIISQCLAHLLSWADGIYILDLGSTDDTWNIVQETALRDKRVVPFKQVPWLFNDNMRGIVFNEFRSRFKHGDWVLRVDADEFYHVHPPEFVKQRLGRLETAVWLQWYYFKLLKSEVADYESGRVDILQDRHRPISDRRRHYKISEYGEPRMFRYRRDMKWADSSSFPFNAGYVARERIPIRHYPHRDPMQMEARFRLRARMMMFQAGAGGHWKLEDWHEELVDEQGVSQSSLGRKRGLAGEAGIDTGPLLLWKPGTELEEKPLHNHIKPPLTRLTQRIIHPALLPLLDARRPPWNPAVQPLELPAHVQEGLRIKSAAAAQAAPEAKAEQIPPELDRVAPDRSDSPV
jgi:hypothetical protein